MRDDGESAPGGPAEARGFARQARLAARDGHTEAAIRLYHLAFRADPSEPRWARELGICYATADRWNKSANWLVKARGIAAEDFSDWKLLLATLYRRKDWNRLEKFASEAVTIHPSNPDMHYQLGAAQWANGFEEEARRTICRGLDQDSSAPRGGHALAENSGERFPDRFRMLRFVASSITEIRRRASLVPVDPSAFPRKVFVYWAQGIESAPAIVKICHKRLLDLHGPENVMLLDNDNLGRLLRLPDYVVANPNMSYAHRSDIIRIELLARYGGIWADATCLCTENVLERFNAYLNHGFFAFRRSKYRIANWFLVSSPGSVAARMMTAALPLHWAVVGATEDYFIFQHMFEAMIIADEDFASEWSETEAIDRGPALAVAQSYHDVHNPKLLAKRLDSSPVHKLTHKFHLKYQPKEGEPVENSTLNHILEAWPSM